jgi:hypothetical protein
MRVISAQGHVVHVGDLSPITAIDRQAKRGGGCSSNEQFKAQLKLGQIRVADTIRLIRNENLTTYQ